MKATVRIEKSKDRSIKKHSRNSHYVSRKATPSKNKPSDKVQRVSTQKKAEKSMKGSLIEKRKNDVSPGLDSAEKMDIFCNYVRERRKMNSEKSSPNKKSSKTTITEQSSAKKPEKKMVQSSAQKNLLAISNTPLVREQRVSLKVNLLK